ncbi:MAG: DUF1697 domain-containing protein [Acidobacteriota bacterium]
MKSIALLRGINVGGKNKLPMAELREIFAGVGCRDVVTYIQSGNVVYSVYDELAPRVAEAVSVAITARFGYEIPVVTRDAEELAVVVDGSPYVRDDLTDEQRKKALHVAFLADEPPTDRIAALDPRRSPGDEFTVRGRTIYLFCPNGLARTKLTNAYFDSVLGTISTMRNWRTTLKLLELSR